MRGYGQFCPVAKAAEIICERWTLLILRELVCGSCRFNEIRRGVPLISPTLLSQRLKQLERECIIERCPEDNGQGCEYRLTERGQELKPLIELAGTWGHRWARSELEADELDAGVLMWDMRRRLQPQHLPQRPLTLQFHYPDARDGKRNWWVLVDAGQVDLCLTDPGQEPNLYVVAQLQAMTAVWMGDETLNGALSRETIRLFGPRELTRNMSIWLGLSIFADVRPAPTG
ncbi:helix-turn-helix transcriptional regulator [Ectothiorhodospiraceae bacterium WFHF3C12]|nr:helix-turn-helix transcriptional regulator [Ectothiorhodospiraceae bacterium WFHF3C12]